MKTQDKHIPQLRLRTNLVAGESLQACMNNLDYWTNQLQKKCMAVPYNAGRRHAPGYAPELETEMQPWQAGGV